MGLDAIVYRKSSDIRQVIGDRKIDGVTGEPCLDETDNEPELMTKCISIEKRLGNAASIGEIHGLLTQWGRLNEDGVLLKRVLSSASHSGDFVPLSDLDPLLDELLKVRNGHLYKQPIIREFIDDMLILCNTSKEENNPIVFV